MSANDLWQTRDSSWAYLQERYPSRVSVVVSLFQHIDKCVDAYEAKSGADTYARICGLTLLKAKNLGLGSLSLLLDGFGQESGALLRPMLEYTELLTYFNKFPEATASAADNELPKAGQRAKAIGGKFQALREYLNQHASHSSYSHPSLSHLLTRNFSFRKMQEFVPHVLEANLQNLVLHHLILLQEAVIALERVDQTQYEVLADSVDRLKNRTFDVYQIAAT